MNKFVIAVYVDNRFGVLTRVTSMFTRRGFNIDALTVGETECPEYSRITICLSGDGYAREQLINQLRKLHNVKKVDVLVPTASVVKLNRQRIIFHGNGVLQSRLLHANDLARFALRGQ